MNEFMNKLSESFDKHLECYHIINTFNPTVIIFRTMSDVILEEAFKYG